jgi:hypothetical protein
LKELVEYRTHLINKLEAITKEFRDACLTVTDRFESLDNNEWNVHQIAVHTRDVNRLVYGLRAKRTAQEDNPEFQNFDGDGYMAQHYDKNESLNELLDGFVKDVEKLCNLLKTLPAEAWSRESRHITFGGGFTLQTWVERDLAHITEHLESIKSHNA